MGERVNIGLLFGNGRPQVEYVEGLPRLANLVASDELAVFGEIMEALRESITNDNDLSILRQLAGPQIQIGEPRVLYVEPNREHMRLLVHNLLEVPRWRDFLDRVETGDSPSESERELDRLIGRVAPVGGIHVESRATLQKLYRDLSPSLRQVRVPALSRAVRSQSKDILLDSVSVTPDDPMAAIRSATTRVARAFWYYKRLRSELETSTGRTVRTIGVLLNGVSHETPAVVEARDYIKHVWQQDADLVVDVQGEPESIEEVREQMKWLVT